MSGVQLQRLNELTGFEGCAAFRCFNERSQRLIRPEDLPHVTAAPETLRRVLKTTRATDFSFIWVEMTLRNRKKLIFIVSVCSIIHTLCRFAFFLLIHSTTFQINTDQTDISSKLDPNYEPVVDSDALL